MDAESNRTSPNFRSNHLMEDERVSLAEIHEVRASGFNSTELLSVLLGVSADLVARRGLSHHLFSPHSIFVKPNGAVQVCRPEFDLPDEFVPPETRRNPKEPLFDHQLVWCLGRICQKLRLDDSTDAGLFSLLNLMTVDHVGTRPTVQRLYSMVKNRIPPDEAYGVLTGLYQELMGNIEDLADESDAESIGGQPAIIPLSYSKQAEITQDSSSSSARSVSSSTGDPVRTPSPADEHHEVENTKRSLVQQNENHVHKTAVTSTVSDALSRISEESAGQESRDSATPRTPVDPPPASNPPVPSAAVVQPSSQPAPSTTQPTAASRTPQPKPREYPASPRLVESEDSVELNQKPAGRYVKKSSAAYDNRPLRSDLENKSAPLTVVSAEVHQDSSRPSSPSESNASSNGPVKRLESDTVSGHPNGGLSFQENQVPDSTPSPASPNAALPPKPQAAAGLVRHNSLKPRDVHRNSSRRHVKLTATPEFFEKRHSPLIRLRAQSGKRKRVSLHRAEQTVLNVKLLDGQTAELNCRSDALVGNIFDTVVTHLNLNENNFFGLAVQENGEYFFLESDQRLEKFAPPGWRVSLKSGHRVTFVLHLRFKFYPTRIDFVRTFPTMHCLYLQLRHDILDGVLQPNRKQLLDVAALALQAEFGDKPAHVNSYFEVDGYVPKYFTARMPSSELKQFKESLVQLHAAFSGMSVRDSERALIESCQAWNSFGAHFYLVHKLKPSSKNPVDQRFQAHQWVAVMPHGIGVCKQGPDGNKTTASMHEWHMIRTLQYDGKRFLLATMENNIAVDHVFYLEHFTKSRYLVKFAAEQHKFMLRMRHWQSTLMRNKVEGHDVVIEGRPVDSADARPSRASRAEEAEGEGWTDQFIEETYGSDAQKLTIVLEKDPSQGLGLTLVDGSVNGIKGVYVKSVAEKGDGRRKGLQMGDCILSINGSSLCNRTRHDAVSLVKKCEREVRLEVLRFHSITAVLSAEGHDRLRSPDAASPEPETKTEDLAPAPLSSRPIDEKSATLTRVSQSPQPEKRAPLSQARRQRAVSDFGAIGDTLPSLNSADLFKNMAQEKTRRRTLSGSSSGDEQAEGDTCKGVYTLPVSSMYDFHRQSDDEDVVHRPLQQPPPKPKTSFEGAPLRVQKRTVSSMSHKEASYKRRSAASAADWASDLSDEDLTKTNKTNNRLVTVQLKRLPAHTLGFRIASSAGVVRVKQISAEPAKGADLREGDRIVSINDEKVDGLAHQDVVNLLRNSGSVVRLVVEREVSDDDQTETIEFVFENLTPGPLGLSLAKIPGRDGAHIRNIARGSAAEEDGRLQVGDQIMAINGVEVGQQSAEAVIQMLKEAEHRLCLSVERLVH